MITIIILGVVFAVGALAGVIAGKVLKKANDKK